MLVPATCEQVFPLLCPVREFEWLPYWNSQLLYSESGLAEADCVFKTDLPERGEMIWVVTRYDPPRAIQYTVFKPDSHVWNLEILLTALEASQSRLTWRHTFTGLTAAGNDYLTNYTDEKHQLHLSRIERSLVHFLSTGRMINE